MPARTLAAAGVRLTCSAMRWLVCRITGSPEPMPAHTDHGNHQHPASASMASTMSPSNKARTDANDARQCTNDMLAWTLTLVHHPHDLPNLAALHGDVN